MTGAERFVSDTKDYDITGAMYVNDDGDDTFNAIFWQRFVLGIDTGRLMGDPQSRLHQYSYSVPLSVILDTAGRYLSVKRDMHLRITNIYTKA